MTNQPNDTLLQGLNTLLADHQVFYQKLRGYHWNVRGPRFFDLHPKFEELYRANAEHVDSIAERLATLGAQPAATMKAYLAATRLDEDAGVPSAEDMVRNLVQDLRRLATWTRELTGVAEAASDRGTANLLDDIGDQHEKQVWMLQASLEA